MSQRIILAAWTLALLAGAVGFRNETCGNELSARASALDSIEAAQLKAHTDTLADDSFEGREAGSRGGQATGNYLLKKLEAYGLAPGGDRGAYFQQFGKYRNVLAVLPGSDETLKDEFIIIGAHFDHVGFGTRKTSYGPGYIHNGADDNASGTASLLEVAEAFSELPVAPRRSIIFAFWDAEEKGLLGSKHWIAHPTVPLDKVRLKINADMVGRMIDDKVIVYGTRTAPGLRQMVAEANRDAGLNVSYVWWINPRSDHYTFVKQKIPVLMLHTGLHKDYHRATDDADKLNIEGMQRVTQLFFSLAYDLAQCEAVPAWRKEAAWESTTQRKIFEAAPAPAPPRLGITWSDFPDLSGEPGLLVKSVTGESAAHVAGLQAGDRILQINGHQIQTGNDLRRQILAAPSDVPIVIQRTGKEKPITLQATLPGAPVQLGISWRENSAEPRVVTVVSVLPASPAADAGLQRLDRIYAVDGESFADSAAFETLVLPQGRAVRFQVERQGRLFSVEVKPNDVASPADVED